MSLNGVSACNIKKVDSYRICAPRSEEIRKENALALGCDVRGWASYRLKNIRMQNHGCKLSTTVENFKM